MCRGRLKDGQVWSPPSPFGGHWRWWINHGGLDYAGSVFLDPAKSPNSISNPERRLTSSTPNFRVPSVFTMSYSYDILIDARLSLEELSAFLSARCEVPAQGCNRFGQPIHECDEFFCYLMQPDPDHISMIQNQLRFTPTWRLQSHFETGPSVRPYPVLVGILRKLLADYDCNFAWLGDCSHPIFLKLDRKITVQGDTSQTDYWTGYLHQVAREMGFPFDVVCMPSF